MRDNNPNSEDEYNYSPNELANLSRSNPARYREIVESNLEPGDSIDKWHERNRKAAQSHLPRSFPLEGLDGQ